MTETPPWTDEAENERHREKARKHKAARDKIMATKTGEKGLLIVHTGTGKGKTIRRARHGVSPYRPWLSRSASCSSSSRRMGHRRGRLLARFPDW